MGGNNYLFTMAGFRLGHCWDYNAPSVPFEPGLSGACSCAQAASGCRPRSSLSLHCALCRFSHRPHLPPSLRRGRRGLQPPDPTGSIWKVPWAKRGHTGPPWARRLLFPLALALSCGPWFTLRTLAVCQALSCLKEGWGWILSTCLVPTYTSACLGHPMASCDTSDRCSPQPRRPSALHPRVLQLVGGGHTHC